MSDSAHHHGAGRFSLLDELPVLVTLLALVAGVAAPLLVAFLLAA